MRDAGGIKPVFLSDYQPPAFLVETVHLDFTLEACATLVNSRLHLKRNPEHADPKAPLWLDGSALELLSLAIDSKPLAPDAYHVSERGLDIPNVPDDFVLEISVRINPQGNTALEGLYMSHGMLCTQCEAQGFRHITFYPDRPDVLSKFTTTVRGNKADYPLLLSNGNPIAKGENGNSHWVTWEDPFPKPSYLFALIAGDLGAIEDSFTTMSGRRVTLKIFAEERDLDKLDYAMTSLKNAMAWDEKTFGREYDLDLFMIVAVSHFNMGAMENKGLNVFNTSCVLAHPKTTTDAGFQRVESVVAHEYFHNWSGNRVTCRDWFQLSLKEGFTVFREHDFASDMNNRAVKRVEDVSLLRSHQFPQDQGPMAHPVRPASYQKIDNFYTLTIYEKGAEVVGMQARLLGRDKFRTATDDYFARFDGQAVTCDDFVDCVERAGDIDLSTSFKRWYSQAGTPQLTATDHYSDGTYTLTLTQHTPATPGQSDKQPVMMPVVVALLGANGPLPLNDQGDTETTLILDQAEQQFTFTLPEKPVPSLLRGFSAPVVLDYAYTEADLARLFAKDSDGFCRWDAAQRLYSAAIERLMDGGKPANEVAKLAPLLETLLTDTHTDAAEKALLLGLPAESVIADRQPLLEPARVHSACAALKAGLAEALETSLWKTAETHATPGDYQPIAADIAKRSLRWCALAYLASLGGEKIAAYLNTTLANADNMTDELNALRLLSHYQLEGANTALTAFATRWHDEALVMDKWFMIQATRPAATALDDIRALFEHPQFDMRNPNRVRSLLGTFAAGNPVAFHQESGAGYDLFATKLAELDHLNPQISARLGSATSRLAKLPEPQQSHLRTQLQQLVDNDCSDNLAEVLSQILAS